MSIAARNHVRASSGGARRAVMAAGLALALSALTACAPGGSAEEDPAASAGAVNSDAASITGTIQMFDGTGLQSFDEGLIAAFNKEYPNIKVELRVEPDATANVVLAQLVASSEPPDIMRAGSLTDSVEKGVLTNLDAYAKAYDWTSSADPSFVALNSVSAEGALGSGSLYAYGQTAGPVVGVFYNKKLAAQIGMTEVPADLAAFEAVMQKAKDAGKTPMVVANKIGLLGHLWNILLGNYGGPQAVNDILWLEPGATVDTPEALEATETVQAWATKGFFNEDLNALDQDPSYAQLINDQAVFTVQGNWVLGPLEPMVTAENLGFFPLPPVTAGGDQTSMSSQSLAFSIPSKSKAKDAAAVFLDWVSSSPQALEVAYDTGFSAGSPDATAGVSLGGTVQEQLSNAYALIAEKKGLTNWVVNATPEMPAAVNAGLQELAAEKVKPQEFLTKVQSTYTSSVG